MLDLKIYGGIVLQALLTQTTPSEEGFFETKRGMLKGNYLILGTPLLRDELMLLASK
jgi:hypothetical protein